MWRRPSALTVASCLGESPMRLRVSWSLSFLLATRRLLPRRNSIAALTGGVQVLDALDPPQRVHGRLEHVVRVVGAQRLGEDVLHAGRLEHRPHRAPGDDAGAGDGRLQHHPARAEVPGDLAGDRRLLERHENELLLGVLHGLPDGLGHLVGLAEAHADMAPTVAHHDQGREREAAATLDDLGHPVDRHHPVVELEHARIDPGFRHSVPPAFPFERRLRRRNPPGGGLGGDRKSTRLNSSHGYISYAVFCLKKKKKDNLTMKRRMRSVIRILRREPADHTYTGKRNEQHVQLATNGGSETFEHSRMPYAKTLV